MATLALQQTQSLSQIQTLSQRQIQSLELLFMSADTMREAVYKALEENPALELVQDKREEGTDVRRRELPSIRLSSGYADDAASDTFQSALEATADERKLLSDHLLSQLNVLTLSKEKKELCTRLIYNLDKKGFHIFAPESLLKGIKTKSPEALLEACLKIVQGFDPAGVCTKNAEESLLVQAKLREDAPELALFFLSGHLSFLDPPDAQKIVRKTKAFLSEQKKLFASQASNLENIEISEEAAKKTLAFIRTLDPYPAHNFGTMQTQYIAADVFVSEAESGDFSADAGKIVEKPNGAIVFTKNHAYQVRIAGDNIPTLCISKDFASAESSFAKESVRKAKEFIDAINLRQSTIVKAVCAIVIRQERFFAFGQGHLAPLTQQDIADKIGVHHSTISRMAHDKYLRCAWGLFPVGYFFSAKASVLRNGDSAENSHSQDEIMHEIKKILLEKDGKGRLTDQKICDILAERGFSISRRTVAKYRSKLNIASSFSR